MLSSPVFYAWIAWLLVLAAFAVIRLKIHRREEQQREERKQRREAERRQRSTGAIRRQVRPPTPPPDYRDQLIAAGVIRPAAEPDTILDPAPSM